MSCPHLKFPDNVFPNALFESESKEVPEVKKVLLTQLCHFSSIDCSLPGSSVHGISRQEYWSGFPCPPPGDLPNPGVELASLGFPALSGSFFTTDPPGKPPEYEAMVVYICLIVLVMWKSQFLKSHS